MVILQAVLIGMLVAMAGTIPRNIIFAANLRVFPAVPWAVPVTAAYLWFYWRYLNGVGPPDDTRADRRASLRANGLPARLWAWALLAGSLGIVALVLALRVANRLVVMPQQQLPDLGQASRFTVLSLLIMSAPIAGVVEEASFRGYMQGPIERSHGIVIAILITGTMFGLAHLDFRLILWPYYLAVAAIYGTVTYLTNSILPAVVLHTAGNIYSGLELLHQGQAEWQAGSVSTALIWTTGADASFWIAVASLAAVSAAMMFAYFALRRATRSTYARST